MQLDAIDQVQDLLSYGVLDWAVTDSEAMESLALLNALPDAQLTSGLARLENKFLNRLLDNLPDAARSGPGYQRVVQAFGAARAAGTAVSDLGYGLFDWVVTVSDVIGAYNTLVNLKPTQQETFLLGLEKAERFGRLVSNSNGGHLSLYLHPWMKTLIPGGLTRAQQKLLRTVVGNTSDLATITLAVQVRFNMTVGPATVPGRNPTPWDAGQLKRTYLVLDKLPEAHTATNRELVKLGQYTRPAGDGEQGAYYDGELAINVKGAADADTIRHETGHSVDARIGWSRGREPANPKRGGWLTYPAHAAAAKDMIADAKSGIAGLPAPQQADVVAEIATSMTNRSTTGQLARIKSKPWWAGLTATVKGHVIGDPTFEAVGVGLEKPWFQAADGGTHLGTHIYQESYTPIWVRYEHQARRPERKLSDYQFRDAGEWFAETYAWYYAPDSRDKGMKLNDKDPDTKAWFDTNVDPIVGTR
ncbi:hypothetical protein LR392_04875 [Arthrobacter sp. AK04]|uniref:hypothetical protein n=1 Tax=Arthrobacter sp. AK04 TaxID=2900048 RepID=UPI001E3FD471|nr:hypothetical protein [Arthrobacter sp. AK04]MCD5341561.1 hypothetical protein [Arthrobacter sp. AK04]